MAKVENKDTTKLVTTKPSSLSLTSTMFSSLSALKILIKLSPLKKELIPIIPKYTGKYYTSLNSKKKNKSTNMNYTIVT